MAGGGGGGRDNNPSGAGGSGGGGAGGIILTEDVALSFGSYSVTIGRYGEGGKSGVDYGNGFDCGENGGNSVFDTITTLGGGGGTVSGAAAETGGTGGSGGGASSEQDFGEGTVGQGNGGAIGG